MVSRGFFVTGTDTGVGKTRVAAALLYAAARLGYSTVGMKPVAAGFERRGDLWLNEDVETLAAASTLKADRKLVNPYALREAIAPHIAAEHQGVVLRIAPLRAAYETLASQAEVILVEGVGGFCAPLDETQDMADLAVAFNLPVILVVGMRLGCLNHALLTAEAIRRRGLALAGWVANDLGTNMAAYATNITTLQKRLQAPLLLDMAWRPDLPASKASECVNLRGWGQMLEKGIPD